MGSLRRGGGVPGRHRHHALPLACRPEPWRAGSQDRPNGDGFGVAWYGARPEPGLYRDILPAWSDPNLKNLCRQTRSRLFLAHVRAATTGATSRSNCHPFTFGRWSFMHDGQIGNFERLRRRLEGSLPDHLYVERGGTTDSELIFLIMLDEGLDGDPQGAVGRTAAFSDGETL
jgi:predicted glutamine amidotransferase